MRGMAAPAQLGSCRVLQGAQVGMAPGCRASRPRSARLQCRCAQSIKARWLIDVRYGVKLEAVALLQEWVRDIGSDAGLTPFNAQISSGAVGVPESRLELEVAFDSIAELEAFWGSIPPTQHKAWSQRAQHVIIDGSPTWHVFRAVPAMPPQEDEDSSHTATSPAQQQQQQQQQQQPQKQLRFVLPEPGEAPQQDPQQADDAAETAAGPLDWKGDPMHINPGDRLPFF